MYRKLRKIMKKLFLACCMLSLSYLANSQEPNFKNLYVNTFEIFDKLVYSEVDLKDLTNENFSEKLGISNETLNESINNVRSEGNKILQSGKIESTSCQGCKSISNEKVIEVITHYREHKDEYEKFKAAWNNGDIEIGITDGFKCGWRFYACCAVCAATIEAFPIYLCCCALCYDEYCTGRIMINEGGDNSQH